MENSSPRTEKVGIDVNGTVSEGSVTVVTPTGGERVGKAIGLGLLLLVVTGVAAFIPVIHLITIPLGLLITIAVVISTLRGADIITDGSGTCPACKAPFRIMRRKFRLPFTDVCEGCGRQVIIRLVS